MQVVHGLEIGNDGLVYVCDRQGDRVQVFDKMDNFLKNILIKTGTEHMPDSRGTAWWVGLPVPAVVKPLKYLSKVNRTVTTFQLGDTTPMFYTTSGPHRWRSTCSP